MSAQRGNFPLEGHLRTGGGTPHFFEIWNSCEKTLQTPHLQSGVMLPSSKTSNHSVFGQPEPLCAQARPTGPFDDQR